MEVRGQLCVADPLLYPRLHSKGRYPLSHFAGPFLKLLWSLLGGGVGRLGEVSVRGEYDQNIVYTLSKLKFKILYYVTSAHNILA